MDYIDCAQLVCSGWRGGGVRNEDVRGLSDPLESRAVCGGPVAASEARGDAAAAEPRRRVST